MNFMKNILWIVKVSALCTLTACFSSSDNSKDKDDIELPVESATYTIAAPECRDIPIDAVLAPTSEDNLVEITKDHDNFEMMNLCAVEGSVEVTPVDS